jgi:serine/threonine protein kinase
MCLVEGSNVKSVLRKTGPMDPARAVSIVGQVVAALDAATADGLVHRDIKPDNVLLTPDDFAYLVDFGIAHLGGESGLTSAGSAIGSVAYMAPERFTGGQVGPQADVYSLACLLYECLTGQPPFPQGELSHARRQPALDRIDIHLYRDHCASKREQTALPQTPARDTGRAVAYNDVITVPPRHHKDQTQIRPADQLVTVSAGSLPPDAQPEWPCTSDAGNGCEEWAGVMHVDRRSRSTSLEQRGLVERRTHPAVGHRVSGSTN